LMLEFLGHTEAAAKIGAAVAADSSEHAGTPRTTVEVTRAIIERLV